MKNSNKYKISIWMILKRTFLWIGENFYLDKFSIYLARNIIFFQVIKKHIKMANLRRLLKDMILYIHAISNNFCVIPFRIGYCSFYRSKINENKSQILNFKIFLYFQLILSWNTKKRNKNKMQNCKKNEKEKRIKLKHNSRFKLLLDLL